MQRDIWSREELDVAVLLDRRTATPGVNRVRRLVYDVDRRMPRISEPYAVGTVRKGRVIAADVLLTNSPEWDDVEAPVSTIRLPYPADDF